jgi:hypothetical protein
MISWVEINLEDGDDRLQGWQTLIGIPLGFGFPDRRESRSQVRSHGRADSPPRLPNRHATRGERKAASGASSGGVLMGALPLQPQDLSLCGRLVGTGWPNYPASPRSRQRSGRIPALPYPLRKRKNYSATAFDTPIVSAARMSIDRTLHFMPATPLFCSTRTTTLRSTASSADEGVSFASLSPIAPGASIRDRGTRPS